MDKTKSLLRKVIIWRFISIGLTYLVTFLFTGDIKSATSFTIFLHLVLMIANYIFEILWKNKGKEND